MIGAMSSSTLPSRLPRAMRSRLQRTARIVRLGGLVAFLAFTPSTYREPLRAVLAMHVVRAALPLLAWFTLLAAIISLVIIRIVLVAAVGLGLSQLALEMLVRVLVIELIPLAACLAVAMRVSVPAAAEVAAARRRHAYAELRRAGGDVLRSEIVPRVLAAFFAVLLLAAMAGGVALVLAYLSAHGFSPWAFERYTRLVGHVFSPALTLVFVLKTLAFAVAVAVAPIGSALHDPPEPSVAADMPAAGADEAAVVGSEVRALVRMFVAVLVIEALSLMGSYL